MLLQLKIFCSRYGYKVTVGGREVLTFRHRMNQLQTIKKLCIYDDVTLERVYTE